MGPVMDKTPPTPTVPKLIGLPSRDPSVPVVVSPTEIVLLGVALSTTVSVPLAELRYSTALT